MKITRLVFVIVYLLTKNDAVAQLCTGSLGDPIVNITFGAGNNPGPALSAATTNYTYWDSDCPNDGFYALRNSTSSCFGFTWHSLQSDHTGNPDGYFMLVNASLEPSAFYFETVKNLCSNTVYEFAAWVVNVLSQNSCGGGVIQPNLTFTIEKKDGTILQTYNTGFIPASQFPQWKQYGFFFATPPGVSEVAIRIFNNSQGGCGNDLALDDITFRPCGPRITAFVEGYATDSLYYCDSLAHSFTLRGSVSAGFANPRYQWQVSTDGINWAGIGAVNDSTLTVNFAANATVKSKYRLAAAEQGNFNSANCMIASPVITIVKTLKPTITVDITGPACKGGPVTFTATGGARYSWYKQDGAAFGEATSSFTIPAIEPNLAGKIYIRVESAEGCANTDSTILQVLPKPVASVSFDSTSICTGGNAQLSAGGGISYAWLPVEGLSQPDIPGPVAAPVSSTNYIVTVTGSNRCTDTASVVVYVIENIKADAGADKIIIKGDAIQLVNQTADGIYSWFPDNYLSNAAAKEPVASPPQDIDYILTASSASGCNTDMDTVHIIVYDDIYVPNAFSPDGNGFNDTWNIPALNTFPGFELYLYNRTGVLVYQCKNKFTPWDGYYNGVPAEGGAYVYLIKLNNAGRRILKGNLILAR